VTDAIIEIDREWRLTYINDRAQALVGRDDSLIGCDIWQAFPHSFGSRFEEALRLAANTLKPVEFEDHVIGSELWHIVRAFPSDQGLAVYFEDITQRKSIERAMIAAEARYRAVADTAVDAIIIIDEQANVVSFNMAAERLFGYTADMVVGQNVKMLMPEPDRSAHDGYLDRYKQTGQAKIIGIGREVEGKRKDGTLFPMDLSISEWWDGDRRFFTGILRDITARKAGERDLRAALDKAEQAEKAKSTFLAAASHDLRQPVQAMVLLTEVLRGRQSAYPALGQVVTHLHESTNALSALLEGLLDISRLDAGLVEPNLKCVCIGETIRRIVGDYVTLAQGKGLKMRTVASGGAWARTDIVLFERILRNLLENAVRYTNRGGVLIGCRHRNGTLSIHILDTGAGIAADQQEAIFQEFYQVGNSERDRVNGLGLGLSIVRRLAELLHLELGLTSIIGKGSAFTLVLPTCEPVEEARPAVQTIAEVGGEVGFGLVLIVDDDTLLCKAMQAIFEGWGCEVITASGGDQAVARTAQVERIPDAIIADYRLREGHTGLMAIRQVQEACGRAIPAIVLTGDTAPERIREVQQSGYLIAHKPVMPHRLKEILAAAIRRAA